MKDRDTLPDLGSLSSSSLAALEALQQALSEMKLTRHDEWEQVFFGSPWVVRCRPEGKSLTLEVQPEKPQELHKELFSGWQPQQEGRWTLPLSDLDVLQRALPLIRATYHQSQKGEIGRSAQVKQFVAELRAAFYELGPDITVKETKTTEQYWRGDIEIARVRVNKDSACLMLRHAFTALDNPERIGEGFQGNRQGWPVNHFEAYMGNPAEIQGLKPLLRQTYEKHPPKPQK